ncbi:DNA repair protein RecO [Pseudomonadota bacterium]
MRIQNEPAILLHSRPYSESSLLLEVFSSNFGRLGLMAKGARRLKSRYRGQLSLFQPLLVSWSGKGELPILTGVELHGPLVELKGNPVYCGFYLNELILKLLHRHDAHQALFEKYTSAIELLVKSENIEAVLRVFEKHLLTELGYALILERDSNTRTPIQAEKKYSYVLDQGPVSISDSQVGKLVIHGQTLIALAEEVLEDKTVLLESKQLLRAILNQQLDGKTLKSRQLMSQIKQFSTL